MSRFTNSFLDRIIYGNSLLKSTAFHTKSEVDIKLIEMAANLAKDITDLRLTDLELALYSAVVLFDCGKLTLFLSLLSLFKQSKQNILSFETK